MAASLAHDINNILLPLSSITDRMLEAPRIQGETRESLVVLVALIDHLRALSKNLLLFAQDPEREGTSGTTDLASWSRQVKGLMEIALMNDSGRGDNGTPGIRLDWSIPSSVPAVGVAPHRLTQAMLNILHNARDAILAARDQRGGQSDFGHIQVLARPLAEQFVEVAIIDNGCGMDSDTTRRSTEPFFTTKDGRSTPGTSGNGFGLAMVHAICERVHGRLDIESRLGEGTTVTLTLPVAHPSRMNR
ncbi:MAG: sensor histidine kinase [Phycisphaerales bacterium]